MARERYATITEIKPNYTAKDGWGRDRRYVGYVEAMDCNAEKHFFYNGSIDSPLRKFPELKEGDRVKMKYEKGGNFALWFVSEIINDEVLDNEIADA